MQLDELVRTALTERRDLLEQIVKREVEAVVGELVDAELNGNASPATTTPDRPAPPPAETKLCTVCNVEKPADAFERGRRQCRECRRRAREQNSDDEEPHPATPQTGRKGRRRREQDDAWAERRRQLIAAARPGATVETINGRQFRVLRLAPQCAPALSP